MFRGLIRCTHSGKICTTDQKKGYLNYLICYDATGKKQFIKEEIVHEQVARIFDSIHIPDLILKEMDGYLKTSKKAEIAFRDESLDELNRDLKKTTSRIDALFDLYIDKKIDEDLFKPKMAALKLEKAQIENKVQAHSNADDKFNETLLGLLNIANNAGEMFRKGSNLEVKRLMMKLVIRTLELDGKNVGFSLCFPYSELQNFTQNEKWRPHGDSNPGYRRERAMS